MKLLTLKELQDIEYNILCAVADLCEANQIRYGLAGGTLLGAVRHGGFIPWDDDVDIEMPRPDYQRFILLSGQLPDQYEIDCPYNNAYCFRPYVKVVDKNTKLIEDPNGKRIEGNVYIDIFPIDGMPDTPDRQERHRKKCMRLMNAFTAFRIAHYKINETSGISLLFWKLLDVFQRWFIRKKLLILMERECLKYSFDKSTYCSEVIAGYDFKDTMPAIVYSFNKDIIFIDRVFKTFQFPEYYLINIYGEYWKLPPEEKRISQHMFLAYYIDEENQQ